MIFLNTSSTHDHSVGDYRRIAIIVCLLIGSVIILGSLMHPNSAYAIPSQLLDGKRNGYEKVSTQKDFSIVQQQLRAYHERLEESEDRLQVYQQENGIVSLETQINLLLSQRNALDSALKESENRMMGFKESLTWVKEQISHVSKEVPLTSTSTEQSIIGSAKNNLLNLQLKEQQLLAKYTKDSPHVRSLRQEMQLIRSFITEQEAKLAGSVTTGKNPLYAEMEMQLFRTQSSLISAEAESRVLVQQIVALDKELDRLRSLRPKLDEHQRQVKADEANYLNYLAKVGNSPPTDYQVQVGDQLDIKFFFNPELNESILVRPDGRIALQLVGEISVIGLTVKQIREILIENYAGQLKNPEIAVLLRTSHVLTGDFRPSPQ